MESQPDAGRDADLRALMARYQEGDGPAADGLIRRMSPMLYRFFLAQSASRRDADDLLQETWLRIHGARQTYRPGEDVLPWVYAIARHVRVDHYRRARRAIERERPAEGYGQAGAFDQRAHLSTAAAVAAGPDVAALLRELPESQREVIVMLKFGGLSLEEVARATASSVGSVKQKAHRAYTRLRESLARMGFGGAGSDR